MSLFARLFPDRAARSSAATLASWAPTIMSAEARAIFDDLVARVSAMSPSEMREAIKARDAQVGGYVREGRTAVVPLSGVMLPARNGFLDYIGADYTATPEVTGAIWAADQDDEVDTILVATDSPGGSVKGVAALHRAVIETVKPVHFHATGLMASAAYYGGAAAASITADPDAIVGSIGTMAVVDDSSKMLERAGITRHLLATGPLKGQGTPGVPVSKEALAEVQAIVDAHFARFRDAVAVGRQLEGDALAAVTTGGAWIAARAAELGLVDEVVTTPGSLSELMGSSSNDAPETGAQQEHSIMSTVSVEAFNALQEKVEALGTRLETTAQERDQLAQTVTKLEAKAEADAQALVAVKTEQRKTAIDAAAQEGRIAPAMRPAVEKMAEAYGDDVDGFKAALATYPVVTSPDAAGGTPAEPEDSGWTDEEAAMAAAMGLTRDEWVQANKEDN